MTKQERLTAYRCAILAGKIAGRYSVSDRELEEWSLAVLRAETDGIDRECDIGSCASPSEIGSEFCKFHFEANR